MTTLAPEIGVPMARPLSPRERTFGAIAIWLGASVIAVFLALMLNDSTFVDGAYLPRGNDSFYHARRILDAAVGTRGFYQFDERLHAPDGAWISWPWAYDWLMAEGTRLAALLAPGLDPAMFMMYVPVAWILVNAALFLLAARAIGLPLEMQALALLCFAISPLTQLLHSAGMVDHHYVEHTFVLLTIWLGLRWFQRTDDARSALALGVTLGLAPAFHNGLFILQLLPLATIFVLWLRGATPGTRPLRALALGLLVTTQLVLLPSEPYRQGLFEFGLLSWFHFYIAICTIAALAFMAWHPFSRGALVGLVMLSALLMAPLGKQLLSGAGFLSASFSILDQVVEARSPYRLFTETFGPTQTASYYGWLLLAAPLLVAWFAYNAARERSAPAIYYATFGAFGVVLLLTQFRLHYFGFFAFVTGMLVVVDRLRSACRWHRGGVFVATLTVTVLAYQPALRERLFLVYAPGGDTEYAAAMPIFHDLGRLCAEDPGVVLANSDDGSPILFHSECSVVANNFILRAEDKRHIDEVDRLMRLAPAEIARQRPDIKYLFVRAKSFSVVQDDTAYLVEDVPIAKQLFLDANPPAGFTLIRTILQSSDEGPRGMYARLYTIGDTRPLDARANEP